MGKSKSSLIVILCLLVLGLSSYIIYDKFIDNKTGNNVQKFVEKNYPSKDLVYDASYEYKVIENPTAEYYDKNFPKKIVVPYINIKTIDAERVNNELKAEFNKRVDYYNSGTELSNNVECNYKRITNDNILSVKFTCPGQFNLTYDDTYNFDLKTGKLLSFEDVYKIAGFNTNNIHSKVEQKITTVMREKLKDPDVIAGNLGRMNEADISKFTNESITTYRNLLAASHNNTIKYYLDADKKLNIIINLSIPLDKGIKTEIIKID